MEKSNKINEGDLIYMYVTHPTASIQYLFQVLSITTDSIPPSDQLKYRVDEKSFLNVNQWMILKPLKFLNSNETSAKKLKEIKLIKNDHSFQGALNDKDQKNTELFDYLDKNFNTISKSYDFPEEANTEDSFFPEGAKYSVTVNKYERDQQARSLCIAYHGTNCKVCDINFEKTYGYFAKDFIHVHHIVPISKIGQAYLVDPIKDLIPVCPNCHAMLHRRNHDGTEMTIEKLRSFLSYAK